jgi:hypothetical protein
MKGKNILEWKKNWPDGTLGTFPAREAAAGTLHVLPVVAAEHGAGT